MSFHWKKIFCCLATLLYLFALSGCEREREKTSPSTAPGGKLTLTYIAGNNGSLVGDTMQSVDPGKDGSPVEAVPAEHYHFAAWSDGITAAKRTDFNISADLTVTANFAIDQYTLAYTAGENGRIEGDASQVVDFGGAGTPVTAVPAPGYRFLRWSDGIESATRVESDVKDNFAAMAEFTSNNYTLTYAAGEHGSIEGATQQTVANGGDGSPVAAVPAAHYHFTGWSDGIAAAKRTDFNVQADLEVKANFAIDQYTLTYIAGENGTIEGANTQTVKHGSNGSPVTAKPSVGFHFKSWSDGVDTARRTDTNVQSDLAATAEFARSRYTLTYTAEENGSIEGTSIQTVEHGSDGSPVTAVAGKGYHFQSWSDGVATAQRIDSKVTEDLTVNARFEINTYTVGGSVSGLVAGTQLILQNNGGDDLVIEEDGDFTFVTELPNNSKYEVLVLTQPTSPNQTCTVTNGTGTIPDENVTDVSVSCILNTYTIGGKVSGLPEGDQLILLNNETDKLVIEANGLFSFTTPLDDGSQYTITIQAQPKRPNWTCELENDTGILAGMDVTDVIVDCYPEVVLKTTAGIRRIKLDWNIADFPAAVTFKLCVAQDDIYPEGFNNCRNLKGGALETIVDKPPLVVSKLTNDMPYWFQMEANYATGRKTLSEVVKATPFGGLNDTGIDWCADDTANRKTGGTKGEKTSDCELISASHPGQDAQYGRDMGARSYKVTKIGSGSAGFDFTKICMNGEAAGQGDCPPNPALGDDNNNWACTRDNVTGLVWEMKTKNGLRSQKNSYSWYNPDDSRNGGDPGLQNAGSCKESSCDTKAFIEAVNALGLCGANDWRLPTRKELLSIVDNGRFNPAIDTLYFPNTMSGYYWTSSAYPDTEEEKAAWQVNFKYGEAYTNTKVQSNHVRLVRGRTATFGFDNP